jgi:hypothetical protein
MITFATLLTTVHYCVSHYVTVTSTILLVALRKLTMKMNKLGLALSLILCAAARGQVTEAWTLGDHQSVNSRSAAGTADTFACDHVTVAFVDHSVILQFTEYAGHYMSFTGTADSVGSSLINLDEAYLDGHQIPTTADSQCALIFVSGELQQIICSGLTFTVSNGESK